MAVFQRVSSQTFSSGDKQYYYWLEGDPKNPPLLLIPGFTGTHSDLLEFAKYLKDTYFLIIPDLPGWGKTPANGFTHTLQSYANYLKAILDHERIEKLSVLGHCMGATLALEFVHRFQSQVAQLFLVSPSYLEGSLSGKAFHYLADLSEKSPTVLRPALYFWRSRVFAVPLGFFIIQSRSFRKKLRIILQNTLKQSHQNENVVEENWNSLATFNYEKIKDITIPIHIIHGKKDFLLPLDQIATLQKLLPQATLDVLDHAGHMPPVETPESLATVVKKFS